MPRCQRCNDTDPSKETRPVLVKKPGGDVVRDLCHDCYEATSAVYPCLPGDGEEVTHSLSPRGQAFVHAGETVDADGQPAPGPEREVALTKERRRAVHAPGPGETGLTSLCGKTGAAQGDDVTCKTCLRMRDRLAEG